METLLMKMLSTGFYGSVMILAVLVLRLILHKAPKKSICFLWLLVFLRLLIPVEIHSRFSLQPSVLPVRFEEVIMTEKPEREGDTGPEDVLSPAEAPANEETTESVSTKENPNPLLFIWCGGILVLLGAGAVSYVRLRLLVREAVKNGEYWTSDRIQTAFVLGFLRPRIFIPVSTEPEDLPYILAHEQMHLKHWDLWRKLLGYLALSVHWFNPLIWIAYILFCKDTELSCDASVVRTMSLENRKLYSKALVHCSIQRKGLSICPVAFGEVSVKERIMSVLNDKKPSFWMTLAAVLAVVLVTVSLLTVPKEPEIVVPTENGITFQSNDGSAQYIWNLSSSFPAGKIPVIEVAQREFTAEEAQNMASVFFGEAPVYDIGVGRHRQLTQKELQRRYDFLKPFQDDPEKLVGLEVPDDDAAQPHHIGPDLEKTKKAILSAPTNVIEPVWDGMLSDSSLDVYPNRLNSFSSIGEIPYQFYVHRNDYGDFSSESMGMYIGDAGDMDTAYYLGHAKCYCTDAPEKGIAEKAGTWAQQKLDEMAPGKWQIAQVDVTRAEMDGSLRLINTAWKHAVLYHINSEIVPVIHGIPGLYRPITYYPAIYRELQEDEEAFPNYVEEYVGTNGYFAFNANGTFIALCIENPMEEVQVLEEDTQILPLGQLMENAQEQLSHYSAEVIATDKVQDAIFYEDLCPEDITAKTEITEAVLGMVTVPMENSEGHYLQIPAVSFRGIIGIYDRKTGELLDQQQNPGTLVTVNAMDGSIIG